MRIARGATSPFASVLCPVDFSEHSRAALRFAAALASRDKARLHVLFVNDPLLVSAAAAAYDTATLGAASEAELRRFLTTTIPPRTVRLTRAVCEIALGKPAREILRAIRTGRHDVVVVGTKGLNGARRLLLGSTTASLLRRSTVPVLAVPPADAARTREGVPASWPGREIVAAIELGSRARADVERAADMARRFGASLLLVHIVPIPPTPSWVSADLTAGLRRRCQAAERALDAARADLPGVRSTTAVLMGQPADEIAAMAAERKAGLILLGLREHTGLFGEPAGEFAYQVLCHGVAPVMVLPGGRPTSRRVRSAPRRG